MSAAHTPGPWTWTGGADKRLAPFVRSNARADAICKVMTSRLDEYQANARLIAAAPELLAACEKALWQLIPDAQAEEAEGRQDSAVKTSDILRAALAKAGVR